LNQRFFARRTLRRKYGDWFETEWRKKFLTMSDAEWKRAYDEAWKHNENDCVEQSDAELFVGALGAGGSVLDVGCGQGSLAIRFAQAGFQATGMDVSSEAIRIAQRNTHETGKEITWVEGFAENLPFPDKSFDYVTSAHTLEHVRNLPAVAAEFKRVARRKIVILTPRQAFKMYMDNYHTQFFEQKESLVDAFGLTRYECREIDCGDRTSEFQGKAWFYVGEVD
jgi:ubiquinone/menaquinone biosynthesis C-methylase UbiE